MAAFVLLSGSLALASDEAQARVRADIEAFLGAGVRNRSHTIEIPPLASFSVDRSRVAGPLRTELSTRAAKPYQGRVAITVALYAGQKLLHRGVISPYVMIAGQLVVPSRDLRRGEILVAEDLVFAEWDRAKIARDSVLVPSQAIGLRTRRSIRKGRPIRLSQIEGVPAVERGDRVRVLLEGSGLSIQTIGRALEAGAIGEWIRVLNLDSKKEISGRVDREGTVRVAY